MTTDLEKKQNGPAELDQTTGFKGLDEFLGSDEMKRKLAESATRHLSPDRLIRVFLGIAARNPKIYQCTRASILTALSVCTSTGLEPGGIGKLADLIPRRNKYNQNRMELTFQPRYGGLAELARRSGKVTRINAAPVYCWEVDGSVVTHDGLALFEYSHEPALIRHDWSPDAPDAKDDDVVGGYAVAELDGGHHVQLWLSLAAIDKRRKKSQQPNGNFWSDWYPEMVRKTCLRALFSGGLVPMSTEMLLAMEHDPDRWDSDRPTSTRVTRRLDVFRGTTEPAPAMEPIETTAEVVDDAPEGSDSYLAMVHQAQQWEATEEQVAAAIAAAGFTDMDPHTWEGEHADETLRHLDAALALDEREPGGDG